MFNLLYDLHQDSRISQSEGDARAAKAKSDDAVREVRQLRDKVHQLTMVTEALWRIVKTSHKLDDSHLEGLIAEIKNEQAQQQAAPPQTCPNCGRNVSKRANKCM